VRREFRRELFTALQVFSKPQVADRRFREEAEVTPD
jgi:hypothetical protein